MACFNRKEKTIECLGKLYKQANFGILFDFQVFLLDDNSTDGTAVAVKEKFPMTKIIHGDGGFFWNRGMHTAWKAAADESSFDFYLWLNNDTLLYENGISDLVAGALQMDSKAIICGCIESPDKKNVLTYGGGSYIGRRYVSNYPDGHLSHCEVINGNCVLVPQHVFSVVGNLDWTFIHAIGDNDYSLRAKKAGIHSFTSGTFVAACERNASLPRWCLPETQFADRLSSLYSPLGNSQPKLYFKYKARHFGLVNAVRSIVLIHARLLFPSLWLPANQSHRHQN